MQGVFACGDACGGVVDALEVIGKPTGKIPRVFENVSALVSILNHRELDPM